MYDILKFSKPDARSDSTYVCSYRIAADDKALMETDLYCKHGYILPSEVIDVETNQPVITFRQTNRTGRRQLTFGHATAQLASLKGNSLHIADGDVTLKILDPSSISKKMLRTAMRGDAESLSFVDMENNLEQVLLEEPERESGGGLLAGLGRVVKSFQQTTVPVWRMEIAVPNTSHFQAIVFGVAVILHYDRGLSGG